MTASPIPAPSSDGELPRPLDAGPALVRTGLAMGERYAAASEAIGLTVAQTRLLFIVHRRPTNMVGLGTALRLGKSTMTGVVDRMVAAGYLERTADPGDRRNLVISITPAGRAAAERFEHGIRDAVGDLLDPLDGDDRRALAALLNRIVARADELDAAADPAAPGDGVLLLPSE